MPTIEEIDDWITEIDNYIAVDEHICPFVVKPFVEALRAQLQEKEARIKELESELHRYKRIEKFAPSSLDFPDDYFEDLVE